MKIGVIYQLVDGLAAPSQIWPHLPVLVVCSLLRYAASSNKSVPAMLKHDSGTGFLAAEMKEYDA
ncbi:MULTISPECIES: hypothetical protein [unclassified Bradyrhizobium]|uniref:hypothetical protein n=1 Tax=unclassified Bradyrhizobium TaxID=2631580 RepID=UPI001BA81B0C|nr:MULTISPECIES: hypothetical protein [unclassified Bradyrhizobium]MBR1295411.1 hypothetical protein [Bradyrhizobium sp. AUGA SZCCT0042]